MIKAENINKTEQGEEIIIKPFKILDHIDKSGRKHGIAQSPFTTQWTVLE